jgi:hypothetical protein
VIGERRRGDRHPVEQRGEDLVIGFVVRRDRDRDDQVGGLGHGEFEVCGDVSLHAHSVTHAWRSTECVLGGAAQAYHLHP